MFAALLLLASAPTYQFNCEYTNSNTNGEIQSHQMVKGTLSMQSEHSGTWDHVSIAIAQGEKPFGEPAEQKYMDGFTFDPGDAASTKKADFFKSFPPTAVQAENLVWDTQMFLQFAKRAPKTRLGTALKFGSGDVSLAGSGTFTNKNVELTRLGSAKLKVTQCDLIKYDAFFNTIKMDLPVLGEMNLPTGPMTINVFRQGTLVRVS